MDDNATCINHFVFGLNRLDLTVVVAGVGVLFGGHVVGVDFAPWHRTDRPTLEIVHVLTCPTPGPIEPNWLGPIALEGHLRPTFKPTLPTHSILGIHIPNTSQMQTG